MLKLGMEEIQFQIITKNKKKKYQSEIVNFYNRYFPEQENQLVAKNSSIFCIARRNDEIIGVARLLTDYSRYAVLLDLIVRKVERNKGIGKSIVNQIKTYCCEQGIRRLTITTDPRYKWLSSYYQKLGFKVIKDEQLMKYSI